MGRAGIAALLACLLAPPLAAEEARPLALTVNPSGFEPPRESIEEKIARRERRNAFLFRSICRGCGRHEALVEPDSRPFDPQGSLARR